MFSNQSQKISRYDVLIQEKPSNLNLIHSDVNVFICLQEQLSGTLCEVECHLKQWEQDLLRCEKLYNCFNIYFTVLKEYLYS